MESLSRVWVVERDAAALSALEAALDGRYAVEVFASLDAMGSRADALGDVAALVFTPPGALDEQRRFARALARLADRPYTLALVAPAALDALEPLLLDVCDDVALKPASGETLRAQLALAARRPRTRSDVGVPANVLESAVARGASGEVIVRTPRGVGRVFLVDGAISWAHCPWSPLSLASLLAEAGHPIEDDVLPEVLAEAQRKGVSFLQVLTEWNLAEVDRVEPLLQEQLARVIAQVLAEPGGVAMLLPTRWENPAKLRFTLHEMLPRRPLAESLAPPAHSKHPGAREPLAPSRDDGAPVDAATRALVERVSALPGALGAAVLDLARRACVYADPRWRGTDAAWLLVPVLAAEGEREPPQRALSAGPTQLAGLFRLAASDRALHVDFDLAATKASDALRAVRALVRGEEPPQKRPSTPRVEPAPAAPDEQPEEPAKKRAKGDKKRGKKKRAKG